MERWSGKVAVVTGASSGIGLAISKALIINGMIVIGLSRRADVMEIEMKNTRGPGKFYAKVCDVTRENDAIQAFAWIEKNFKTVHVLVNNAGILKNSSIHEMKTADMLNIINTNVVGLLHCTRQALTLMKKNDHEAHIVNINSRSGHRVDNLPIPINVYPATKYAVTAISETLINENRGGKIRVTSISPDAVKTNLFNGTVKTNIFNSTAFDMSKTLALNPEDVADSVVYVISAPPHVLITELSLKHVGQYY